jgi:calcineurin-like phosphoesterase family protein
MINVGVDVWDFKPVSDMEIGNIIGASEDFDPLTI